MLYLDSPEPLCIKKKLKHLKRTGSLQITQLAWQILTFDVDVDISFEQANTWKYTA